jgi:CPA2 family monovalent cation:H+ antiporter-2
VVVLALGLAVSTAGLGEHLGVSDAIGAFMIGLILSSTPVAKRLRSLTHPLRDGFGAIFFFHFGLTIDLGDIVTVVPQILLAVGATVLLAVAAGVAAARLNGFGRGQAANIGLTVLSRGEFSLVLASLALAAGLDPRLGGFAAGYVLVLAVLGPAAVSASGRFAGLIPRRLIPGSVDAAVAGRAVPLDLDVGTSSLHELGTDLLQVRVLPGSRLHGVYMDELRLPPGATPGLVSRNGSTFAAAAQTRLQTHDVLLVFTDPGQRQATERRILAVHRSGRLATWLGDTGT